MHCLMADNAHTDTHTRLPTSLVSSKNSSNQWNAKGKKKQRIKTKTELKWMSKTVVFRLLYISSYCMDFSQPTSRTAWQWVSQEKLGYLPAWVLIKGPSLDQKLSGIIWSHTSESGPFEQTGQYVLRCIRPVFKHMTCCCVCTKPAGGRKGCPRVCVASVWGMWRDAARWSCSQWTTVTTYLTQSWG